MCIRDRLTRIRNANSAKHETVSVPASNIVRNDASLTVGRSGEIVEPRFARDRVAELDRVTDGINRLVRGLQVIVYSDTSCRTDSQFGSPC